MVQTLSALKALLLVLLLTALPAVAGHLLVRWGRRVRPTEAVAVSLTTLAAAILLVATRLARVGHWDGVWAMLALIVGGALAWTPPSPKKTKLAAVTLALGCIGLELLARFALGSPPPAMPLETALVRLPTVDTARPERNRGNSSFAAFHTVEACALLHPRDYPTVASGRLTSPSKEAPLAIVHLGDSMTFGQGVARTETYTAALERATGWAQLNLGMPATSVDYHLSLATHWLPLLEASGWPVKALVVGLYQNDPMEMDFPLDCCPDGHLLADEGKVVRDGCGTLSWDEGFGTSPAWFVASSPVPYALRAGSQFSHAVRHLSAGLARYLQTRFGRPGTTREKAYGHFEQSIAALRSLAEARGLRFVVLLHPARWALDETAGPSRERTREVNGQIRASLARLRVPVLDPESHFSELLTDGQLDRLFLPHGDIHLNAQGHEELANWLEPNLRALLESVEPARQPVP
jgi:hypothetical protein